MGACQRLLGRTTLPLGLGTQVGIGADVGVRGPHEQPLVPTLTAHTAQHATEDHAAERGGAAQDAEAVPRRAVRRRADTLEPIDDRRGRALEPGDRGDHREEHDPEHDHEHAVSKSGSTGHATGGVPAERERTEEHRGRDEPGDESDLPPVVAGDGVEGQAHRVQARRRDSDARPDHPVGNEDTCHHAPPRHPAPAGLSGQLEPVTLSLDPHLPLVGARRSPSVHGPKSLSALGCQGEDSLGERVENPAQAGAGVASASTCTGMPFSTALPDRGSKRSPSARRLLLTPGRPAATARSVPPTP